MERSAFWRAEGTGRIKKINARCPERDSWVPSCSNRRTHIGGRHRHQRSVPGRRLAGASTSFELPSSGPRGQAKSMLKTVARLTSPDSQQYYRSSTINRFTESSLRLNKHSNKSGHRELYSGLIRLHVLYHATKQPIFGLEMIQELERHGYRLSPGTMYPLLHGLERKGLLRSARTGSRPNSRLVYRATAAGRTALTVAKDKVRELFSELFEDVIHGGSSSSVKRGTHS